MTALAAQAALILALGQGWEDGFGTTYAPGLMHAVAGRRGLPVADCMVSYDGAPLGTFVWVRGQTGRLLHCQITDTSAPQDRARHVRVGLIELDHSSAQATCLDPSGPWRACPVQIWR